jgi:alpha-L-fucosidase 2
MNPSRVNLGLLVIFGAVCCGLPAAEEQSRLEVFGTADDGTPLHWMATPPPTPGRHPVVLVIHGGGFTSARENSPNTKQAAIDLAAAGFMVFSIEYRLAPPGKIEGQKSSGRFPDQTNDVHLAVRKARADPRGNGQVGGLGGSAGGYHVAFAALTGTPGDDQLDVGVSLSGALDLSDPASYAANRNFKTKVINYVGSEDREKLLAASPVGHVTASAPPLFLIQSQRESMPPQQLPLLTQKLLAPPVATVQLQLTLPGGRHSFAYWPDVREQSIAFLRAGFARKPAPPAPRATQ